MKDKRSRKKSPSRLLQKFLCSVSFKKKLVLVYVFIVIMPTLLVGFFLAGRLHAMALDRAAEQALSFAKQTRQRIDEMARVITHVSDQLYNDEELAKIVAKKYESSWAIVTAMKNYSTFDDYSNYYREIKDIRFYISVKNLLGNYDYVRTTDDIENYDWYQKTMENRGLTGWNIIYDEELRRLCLAQTRLVRTPNGLLDMGVLVIQADESYLSGFLQAENCRTLLVGEEDLIIASSGRDDIGSDLSRIGFEMGKERKSPRVFDCTLQGEKSIAAVFEVPIERMNPPLRLISVFPTRYLLSEANQILWLSFTIICCSLLLALFLVIFFSERLSRRIRVLCGEMHSIAGGNLKEQITVDGRDEIGMLSQDLSQMVCSINDLIEQVYVADMQKKQLLARQEEIRYKMLSSQTNPHFLFNALESLRMSAHAAENAELAMRVKLLGKILRSSLGAQEEKIPISRELELVENYLDFQQFRFPDRLSYRIERGNARMDTLILPFLIQPLAENSVVHGMEPCGGPCEIIISLQVQGDVLSICVSDNGVGIEEQRRRRLIESLKDTGADGAHIGLRNVHQRIQLYYGAQYGLSLLPGERGGTVIRLRIPHVFS